VRRTLTAIVLAAAMGGGAALAAVPQGPLFTTPPKAQPPAGAPAEPLARLSWRTDLEAAIKEAAASGKLILIYFRADWCEPCRLMDEGPFSARKMCAYIEQHFIPVRVDDTDTAKRSPISTKFEIRVYPSVLVLDAAGKPLHIILAPRPAKELYGILEQVRALPALLAEQERKPDDLEANFALGNAFALLDQLRRAQPYLERATQLDPENEHGRLSQAALMLALVPLEDGKSKQAIENLDAYLEHFKDALQAPLALYYKGATLYYDGRLIEARKVFEEVSDRFPKHAKAYESQKAIQAIDAQLRAPPPPPPPPEPKPPQPQPVPKG